MNANAIHKHAHILGNYLESAMIGRSLCLSYTHASADALTNTHRQRQTIRRRIGALVLILSLDLGERLNFGWYTGLEVNQY